MKEFLKLLFEAFYLILKLLFIIIIGVGLIWYLLTDTYEWIDKVPFLLVIGVLLINSREF